MVRTAHLDRPRLPLAARRSSVGALGIAALMVLAQGCGSGESTDGNAGATLETTITTTEYQFRGESLDISAGDTVVFDVRNDGELRHEMQVLTSEGRQMATTGEIPPGALRTVAVSFDTAGTYQVICDIDDHLSRGQRAQFVVTDG